MPDRTSCSSPSTSGAATASSAAAIRWCARRTSTGSRAGGVSFRRHFAQAAPCGPSRASLYTGMYLMNHRSVLNGTPLDARHDNVALVARRLGYDPALFGYTDTSVDPRTVAPGDPRLRRYEGVLPGFDPVCHLPEGEPFEWLDWLRAGGRRRSRRLAHLRRPARAAGHATGARSTTPRTADHVPHRPVPRHRPTAGAAARRRLVRARVVPAAAPAVLRARAVRHDVRSRDGARAGAGRDAAPRRARSIRCSA